MSNRQQSPRSISISHLETNKKVKIRDVEWYQGSIILILQCSELTIKLPIQYDENEKTTELQATENNKDSSFRGARLFKWRKD